MNELLNWRKNYIYDKNTGKLRNISNTYCLVMKVFYNLVNYDNKTIKKSIINKIIIFNINIFEDGRLEIKTNSQQQDMSNIYSLKNAIQKVHHIIQKIKKINYSKNGKKIRSPDPKFLDKTSFNTKLVNLDTFIISNKIDNIRKINKNIYNVIKYLHPILKLNEEQKKDTNELYLKYRRVNEFEDMDPVSIYISELYNDGKKENEILQFLIKSFKNIEDVENAKLAYKYWYENVKGEIQSTGTGFIMKIKTNPGIGKIKLIEKNIIKININGINDLFFLKK